MAFIVQAPAATAPAATTPGEATPGAKAEDGKETLSKKNAKAAKSKTSAKAAKSVKAEEAEDSGKLDKISQLAGHRYGVPLDKTQISEIDPNALANAVNNNQVDVLFVAGPATGHAIGEAVAAATRNGTAPSFIEIDQADGIAKRDPAFDSTNIEAGTFGGDPPAPTDNLKTLTFPEYLVACKTSRHDRIATLARLIYSSRLSLAAAMPGEVKIEAPSTDKDSAVIVHPVVAIIHQNDQNRLHLLRLVDLPGLRVSDRRRRQLLPQEWPHAAAAPSGATHRARAQRACGAVARGAQSAPGRRRQFGGRHYPSERAR